MALYKYFSTADKPDKLLDPLGPLSKVLSADGTQEVGKITKQWSGLTKEYFTDADNFGIQFPMDLDVKMKAVMLGACFLIDFMFFEKSNN